MRRRQRIELIWELTRREVTGRYKGSLLGIGWSFAYPLLMLAIYTFVFSSIFRARWPGAGNDSGLLFATNLFAGLVIFNLVSECATKSPPLIISQANYVKRVVFPLEALAVVTVAGAAFHAAIGVLLLLVFKWGATGHLSFSLLSLPLLWLPLLAGTLGLVWVVSAASVYIRDVALLVNVGLSVLLFLSPIFFPASLYPERWRPLLALNPLVWMIEQMRAVVIDGQWPNLLQLMVATLVGLLVAWLGYRFFQKARRGFADVL
jgi:lipopolysaccharide transport system permease protein